MASTGYLAMMKWRHISPIAVGLFVGCTVAPHDDLRDDRLVITLRIHVDDTAAYDRDQWMPGSRWNRSDSGCFDVRARALLQESVGPVRLRSSGCSVDSGIWVSMYSGDTVLAAAALEIDHLVPLAEAHRSGGASWDSARKNAYANDLADPDHLVAVDAFSNSSKRDRDPAHWMPSSARSDCRYLAMWVEVKQRWDLSADSAEFRVLQRGLDSCASAGDVHSPMLQSR